jgi:hypothetical protein
VWISFFHGLALLTGRDIAAHDAFQGSIFHTDIFGPHGALFNDLSKLDTVEAERRLRFSERAMAKLRTNEVGYLFKAATSWKSTGLVIGYLVLTTALAGITYGIGSRAEWLTWIGIAGLLCPFIIGTVGKMVVRRLWSAKRTEMGSFGDALPWMTVSTYS